MSWLNSNILGQLACTYPVRAFDSQTIHPLDDSLAAQCIRVATTTGRVLGRADRGEPDRYQALLSAGPLHCVQIEADFSFDNSTRAEVSVCAHEVYELRGNFGEMPPSVAERIALFPYRYGNIEHAGKHYRPVGFVSLTSAVSDDAVNSELTLRLLRHALENVVHIQTDDARDIALFLERFELGSGEILIEFWRKTLLEAESKIERKVLTVEEASDIYRLVWALRGRIGGAATEDDQRRYLGVRNNLAALLDNAHGAPRLSILEAVREIPGAFLEIVDRCAANLLPRW